MKAVGRLVHRFVEEIPEPLSPGLLYVSPEHRTMIHLCACGCDNEVVLPLSPADWRMTYDGEAVSVWPSVGNWSLPCRSHYVIDRGRVRWAEDWTDEEIEASRSRDRMRQAARFSTAATLSNFDTAAKQSNGRTDAARPRTSFLSKLRSWFG